MPDSALDDFRRDLHIALNITRQRRPAVLRELRHENRLRSEEAQRRLIAIVCEVLDAYRLEKKPITPTQFMPPQG